MGFSIDSFKDCLRLYYGVVTNIVRFKRKKVVVGDKNRIYGKIWLYGPKGRISFGNSCILRSGMSTNPLGGSLRLILIVGKDGRIQCGNYVGISNSCLRIESELIIEDYVNIGGDCKIYDSDMHSVEYEWRIQQPDDHAKSAPIYIRKGAWIGAHSIILKGVTIGERAVIGAGSIVTKDVPADEVWAGNPARFIKKIEGQDIALK